MLRHSLFGVFEVQYFGVHSKTNLCTYRQGRLNKAHFGHFSDSFCGIVLRIVSAIVPLLEIYVYNSVVRLQSHCTTYILYVFRNGILHLAFAKL